MTQSTVYVVVQSSWGGNLGGCLLLTTGEVLWNHISSCPEWLQIDLTNGFKDRRERLETLYPDGYDVVYVDGEGVIPEEVMAANAAWKAAESAQETCAEEEVHSERD